MTGAAELGVIESHSHMLNTCKRDCGPIVWPRLFQCGGRMRTETMGQYDREDGIEYQCSFVAAI